MQNSPCKAFLELRMPSGLACARSAGVGVGIFLIFFGGFTMFRAGSGIFPIVKTVFEALYGCLCLLPWRRLSASGKWKGLFGCLLLTAVATVFILIFDTLFNTIAMIETGRRPGVPAFQGVLIFLILLQVPTLLFVAKPEFLE